MPWTWWSTKARAVAVSDTVSLSSDEPAVVGDDVLVFPAFRQAQLGATRGGERADQLIACGSAQDIAGRQRLERLGQSAWQADRRGSQRMPWGGRITGDLVRQAVPATRAVQRHSHHGAHQQIRVSAEVKALDLDVGRGRIGRATGHEPDGSLPVLPAPDLERA